MRKKQNKRSGSASCLGILPAALFLLAFLNVAAGTAEVGAIENIDGNEILVEKIRPGPRGGWAYRLTYTVPVPPDVYWRFKTDFDNDFLVENKFIASHRFIGRDGNAFITEDEYTNKPNIPFIWKTSVFPEERRLAFELLNTDSGANRFHYGSIRLYPVGKNKNRTKVVQKAYFDFFGAGFWVLYPWAGGMTDFLEYTARWERETVLELREKYSKNRP